MPSRRWSVLLLCGGVGLLADVAFGAVVDLLGDVGHGDGVDLLGNVGHGEGVDLLDGVVLVAALLLLHHC